MKAQLIKKGFRTPWWVAVEDARTQETSEESCVVVHVQYLSDQGYDFRYFDLGADVPEEEVSSEY